MGKVIHAAANERLCESEGHLIRGGLQHVARALLRNSVNVNTVVPSRS